MSRMLNIPGGQQAGQVIPMVYVSEPQSWEYKVVTYEGAKLPSEADLNELGEDGWELSGVFHEAETAHFYFKRLAV